MKIFIIDAHILFREGLACCLEMQADMQVVGKAGNIGEATESISSLKPDVVLLDIGSPAGNGMDAIQTILSCMADTLIVVLTRYESDDSMINAFRRGAKGYLPKNTTLSKLLATLRALERGEAAGSLEEFSSRREAGGDADRHNLVSPYSSINSN